jgi:TPR repeat protein
LPFVVAAVVLGIIAVLVSGNRGEGPAAPGAIKPRAIEPRPIEPSSIEPRAVAPQAKAPSNPPVAAVAVAPAGVDTDRPGEEARALIATMRASGVEEDLDTVFRKAGESLKRGRIADAHLLYFFAARRGHAPAAFVLGGLYDPVRFDKDRSLLGRPDPLQALKWYRVAAEQGDGEAQARLKSLESWVDARARAGDAEAERLRLSWR